MYFHEIIADGFIRIELENTCYIEVVTIYSQLHCFYFDT